MDPPGPLPLVLLHYALVKALVFQPYLEEAHKGVKPAVGGDDVRREAGHMGGGLNASDSAVQVLVAEPGCHPDSASPGVPHPVQHQGELVEVPNDFPGGAVLNTFLSGSGTF